MSWWPKRELVDTSLLFTKIEPKLKILRCVSITRIETGKRLVAHKEIPCLLEVYKLKIISQTTNPKYAD